MRCSVRWPLLFQLVLKRPMSYSLIYWTEPSPDLMTRLFVGRSQMWLPRFKKVFNALKSWRQQRWTSTHSSEN